jgi:hypothetical protein
MSSDLPTIRFERVKKPKGGVTPGLRSGCTMVSHKSKGVMFGGVSDVEEDEIITSVCLGDMLQYNMDTNKWYPFTLKKKKQANNCSTAKGKLVKGYDYEEDDEWTKFENELKKAEELNNDNNELQTNENTKISTIDENCKTVPDKNKINDNPTFDAPCARFNTMMTISKNKLYLFGG